MMLNKLSDLLFYPSIRLPFIGQPAVSSFFTLHLKEQVLYQYLRSDNDEDNAAPQFGAQLAGDAASAPDAEHQSCQ